MPETEPLLVEATGLRKSYTTRRLLGRRSTIVAVDGVSFGVRSGEVVGLVGESGSGKSTVGRLVMGLEAVDAGRVTFAGELVTTGNAARDRRTKQGMQVVFQDPKASLNPHMRLGSIIGEPMVIRGGADRAAISRRVHEMLEMVGLPSSFMRRYPHELSGGQQQRVAIARALVLRPRFIVADEPITSLDVSIRAQIINLLQDLQREFKLAILFISHDLSIVQHICDRMLVMYKGRVVESATPRLLFAQAAHPYTQALISAVPVPDPERERQRRIITFDPATLPDLATAELREIAPGHEVALGAAAR